MLGHLLNDLVRNGRDIRTGQSAIGNMDRVADRRADDLGLDLGETGEHGGDRFDQLNAGLRNIIQTAKEGADISSTCTSGKKCLVCGEDQRAVGRNSFGGENLDGFQAFNGHRDLNDHVLGVERIDCSSLFDHAFSVLSGRFDLAGDRAVNDLGNFFQKVA